MLAGMSETTNGHDFKALRKAALNLSLMGDDERSSMLMRMADGLDAARERIFEANRADIAASEKKGLSDALMHRLVLNESKLSGALDSVRAVAKLPCPVGRVVEKRLLDEGLVLEKRTYPIGVIGMVFEARPDALIQIVSLAIKSANGIVLKGGSEASRTNETLVDIIRQALGGAPFMMLLSSHRDVDTMLSMEGDVDLIIPRGSNSFVRYCMEHTHIPVMGHADGICSVYVDESADIETAVKVATDSKVQYPAACNAVETVLVHEKAASAFLPRFKKALDEFDVVIHADERTLEYIPLGSNVVKATEEDFHTEYLSLQLAIKVVSSLDEALRHIAAHSSHHTDAIITQDEHSKAVFFNSVDSADVFANCSTRFGVGFRFGLGAGVGISTSKLQARGPVGLEGLTTTKWLRDGNGQRVSDYSGPDARHFIHEDLPL